MSDHADLLEQRKREGERYGPRWKDPESLADVRAQLEVGCIRFVGENPADSESAAAGPVDVVLEQDVLRLPSDALDVLKAYIGTDLRVVAAAVLAAPLTAADVAAAMSIIGPVDRPLDAIAMLAALRCKGVPPASHGARESVGLDRGREFAQHATIGGHVVRRWIRGMVGPRDRDIVDRSESDYRDLRSHMERLLGMETPRE